MMVVVPLIIVLAMLILSGATVAAVAAIAWDIVKQRRER